MTYKIGVLIPSTTNKRDWSKIEDTSLYNVFLKSFLITYNNEYNYTLYLTIDPDDKLYSIKSEIEKLKRFISIMKILNLKLYILQIFQRMGYICGIGLSKLLVTIIVIIFYNVETIFILEKDWVKDSRQNFGKNDNIGLTGPMDYDRIKSGRNSWPGGARFIQTQNFISRKHMDILDFFHLN